jgi:hypothetical protein
MRREMLCAAVMMCATTLAVHPQVLRGAELSVVEETRLQSPADQKQPKDIFFFRRTASGEYWVGGSGISVIFRFDGVGTPTGHIDLNSVPGWAARPSPPLDVAFDPWGNVFVLLQMIAPSEGVPAPVVAQYSPDLKYTRSVVLKESIDARRLCVDRWGNFYIVGLEFSGPDTTKLVHKFGPAGDKMLAFCTIPSETARPDDFQKITWDPVELEGPDRILVAETWPTLRLRRFELNGTEISPPVSVSIKPLGSNDLEVPDAWGGELVREMRSFSGWFWGDELVLHQTYEERRKRADGAIYGRSVVQHAYVVDTHTGKLKCPEVSTFSPLMPRDRLFGVLQFMDDSGFLYFRKPTSGGFVLRKCRLIE